MFSFIHGLLPAFYCKVRQDNMHGSLVNYIFCFIHHFPSLADCPMANLIILSSLYFFLKKKSILPPRLSWNALNLLLKRMHS
ncbi:hypothetical protein BAE44_0026171 [Dichanthelium oligosanthes]|uniref:Uncharacterized protein n=1 Tax=Dichanthelium oligosanthes TaxID=888268 RepID=A0A1E5UIV0_9POAL|nr:hypothetical protein BAE44_0026171 [Dichanthelium oligosanthes]